MPKVSILCENIRKTPESASAADSGVVRYAAGGGGRTRTILLSTDFESVSSASSNTPAYKHH